MVAGRREDRRRQRTERLDEIFVSDADGRNRVQITQLKGPRVGRLRWSPDGKSLVFDASSDHGPEVFTVPATPGGKAARVLLNASNASLSRDGKWIYFQSRGQIWKATVSGGNPQAIVAEQRGAGQPIESADGKYVYFRSRRGIWRIPAAGGEPEEAFVPEHDVFGSKQYAAHQEGHLLHRIRTQRPRWWWSRSTISPRGRAPSFSA